MSLINDALKKAKQTQQKMRQRSQPELPLRPAGTVLTQPASPTWIWASFFALLLAACGYLVWQSFPENHPQSAGLASSNEVLIARAATRPQPNTHSPALKTNIAESVPALTPLAPLKLQSIFYIPGHSTVMISGQSLSAGGHIREFRVVAIKPDSVTLASATETRVLKLP